ncbi:Protein ASP-7 [Aphelenchoides avenae]|nr:Protein ASP-7 [Aphelenchus avenae]
MSINQESMLNEGVLVIGAVTSVPLQAVSFGQSDAFYVVNVSVGTPAQTFRLMLDNGFVDTHVLAKNFVQKVNTTVCQANNVQRNTFNYNASKTFHGWMWSDGWEEWGESPYLPYEDPKCPATFGYESNDFEETTQIGAVSLPSIPASAIVNFTGPLNPDWTADGFFGLATPRDDFETTHNTILRFLAPFPRLQMTIYYARTEVGDGHSGSDGLLTLGGADSVNCESQWTGSYKLNVTEGRTDAWALSIDSVSLGGEELQGPFSGVPIVMQSSFITAPKDSVDAVVKATGAEYDFRTDTFQLDCDRRPSLPDLVFKDKALEYRVPAVDYARKLSGSDKKCTLLISVTEDYEWYLGTSFFRSYCQLLDYATNTFSLAKVLH